jgi:hypothetical protein
MAAAAVASYVQADRQAKAQTEAIEEENRLQQADLARQQEQQREAAAAQMNDHARRSFKDASLFDAVVGEFGEGNSTDRAAAVRDIQAGEQFATLSRNSALTLQEAAFQGAAMRSQALAKINSIQRPSIIGTGLQLASIGIDYKTRMDKQKADEAKLTKPVQ